MSVDLSQIGQLSLFEKTAWRTTVQIEPEHRLVILCTSIPWEELMLMAVPILYDEQGISADAGRRLDLRAHLGAYILQTTFGWTDRWTEEMLRFYIPARIFCGYLESTGSLDRTSIEDFRNRFGEKGARLITENMLRVARKFGLTEPDDVDMDTTVQSAGITHPTEMKLMNHLMKRLMALHGKLKDVGGSGIATIKSLSNQFKECLTNYRFFAKDSATKGELIRKAVTLSERGLAALGQYLPGRKIFDKLQGRYQEEILRLSCLGPQLMDQILYWLDTGKVAKDKIVSLWKVVPKAIAKGKIGKSVEFGRKWIINCYRGGYMLVMAPENPKISDQQCVIESLSLHRTVFEQMPKTYGTDRGMWSAENLELCLSAGVEKIAIQPKGRASALVSRRDLRLLANRRAGIEPRIGHLKTRGMGQSRMKTDAGDLISGYRSALSRNSSLLMRDLSAKTMSAVRQRSAGTGRAGM
jgi:transposase, IS5 family